MIKEINKITGEVVELKSDTLAEIVEAWQIVKEYARVAESLKKQLQKLSSEFVDDTGKSEEVNGHVIKLISVTRKNYDKYKVWSLIEDEDLRFDMLMPDKKVIDKWLKDNVDSTGEIGTELRNTMIDESSYSYYKMEKVVSNAI